MDTLFERMQECSICHREKSCAELIGVSTPGKPRLFTGPFSADDRRELPGSYTSAELYVCRECAAKEGKKPTRLWILWVVTLLLPCLVIFLSVKTKLLQGSAGLAPFMCFALVSVVCAIILTVKSGIRFVPGLTFLIMIAFTPLSLISLLILRKRINEREQVITSLSAHVPGALKKAEEAKEKERQERSRAREADMHAGQGKAAPFPAPVKAAPAEAAQAKGGPGNTFYAFVVEGRGFGRATSDMPVRMANDLKGDCASAAGMRLEIVSPGEWRGHVETEQHADMFTSSAGIKDQIPGIRRYLEKCGLPKNAIEAGITELKTHSLQRVNPIGGVFVFGVPIK